MTSQCPQAALVLVIPTQASFPSPDLPNSSVPSHMSLHISWGASAKPSAPPWGH
jgi:hypothetical protein